MAENEEGARKACLFTDNQETAEWLRANAMCYEVILCSELPIVARRAALFQAWRHHFDGQAYQDMGYTISDERLYMWIEGNLPWMTLTVDQVNDKALLSPWPKQGGHRLMGGHEGIW